MNRLLEHLPIRQDGSIPCLPGPGQFVGPLFIDQIEFIRTINDERGNQAIAELRKRGRLKSSMGGPVEMLENITTAFRKKAIMTFQPSESSQEGAN